ncbi:hypothetical protein Dip518_000413 [Parelusimicrobium proximum]|uniref:hypothetical protein n=1 Tax=Parelusimicrobium proximum TaxID=3228953 RepID=UPI003D16897A
MRKSIIFGAMLTVFCIFASANPGLSVVITGAKITLKGRGAVKVVRAVAARTGSNMNNIISELERGATVTLEGGLASTKSGSLGSVSIANFAALKKEALKMAAALSPDKTAALKGLVGRDMNTAKISSLISGKKEASLQDLKGSPYEAYRRVYAMFVEGEATPEFNILSSEVEYITADAHSGAFKEELNAVNSFNKAYTSYKNYASSLDFSSLSKAEASLYLDSIREASHKAAMLSRAAAAHGNINVDFFQIWTLEDLSYLNASPLANMIKHYHFLAASESKIEVRKTVDSSEKGRLPVSIFKDISTYAFLDQNIVYANFEWHDLRILKEAAKLQSPLITKEVNELHASILDMLKR